MTGHPARPDSKAGSRARERLGKLVFLQVLGLYRLIEDFGGRRLVARFDRKIMDIANRTDPVVDIRAGRIHRLRTDLEQECYAAILRTAIDFATGVAGTGPVGRRICRVMREMEDRTGESCQELASEVGLTRYL
ncbi:MAG: hypothetical protein F4Z15_08975 [Gammaproteobacteria bacterium]|nr:hypothetical protein [Gammaproteobacteria bacterium]MYD77115.1 hypothetical protein [Gammaproteobacteria bacterium]MYJ52977.1 hypothetical protein [Gammaproteobacteria bacterium]